MAVVNLRGDQLVEVFSVRINNVINGGIFGSITVDDGWGSQLIYNRGREDFESFRPGDTLLLTGPARLIFGYDSFYIDVDFKSIVPASSPPPNDDSECLDGLISWNCYHAYNVYDKPLFRDVTASWGSATVNFVVMRKGVDVTVTVWLVDGGAGEDPVDLYGKITVHSEEFESNIESLLFRRSKDECLDVSPGQLIPLARSVVSVPIKSSLIVRADLTARNHGKVAQGSAAFPPAALLSGAQHDGKISGKYGEILVTITSQACQGQCSQRGGPS